VYSLGLVLLECLTGTVAFPGHGVEAALSRLQNQPTIPATVPDGWKRLLSAMTDRDPAARPSAADIGVLVTGLADAPPPVASSTAVPDPIAADALATTAFPAPDAFPEERLRRPQAESTATQLLPAAGVADRPRRPRRVWGLVAAALAAVLLVVVIAVVTSSSGGDLGPATPTYPSVPGQLGSHLRELQHEVTP
jgi:hypothetical protein